MQQWGRQFKDHILIFKFSLPPIIIFINNQVFGPSCGIKTVDLWSCLVCSGQRRLELNLIKKGAGHIDWHNAVGNAKWTGVYLRDVLKFCGADEEGARHCEVGGTNGFWTRVLSCPMRRDGP